MALQTGGFQVPVMPNIHFADGAQLAGRGPGEAIAGFDSGIGLVNAIQNTGNKAILAPIEQDQARARLAQIQAQTQLELAQAPYRKALARIETAKASVPFRVKQGESIVAVPEMDENGQPTGRTHQVIQENGVEYDPINGGTKPYSSIAKPLITADQAMLNQSLASSREAAAASRAELNRIRQQQADTAAKRAEDYFNLTGRKLDISQERLGQDKFTYLQGLDENGKLVLIPGSVKSGQTGTPIRTGFDPNRTPDPFAVRPGTPIVTTQKKTTPSIMERLSNSIGAVGNLFGGSNAQAPAALPDIPVPVAAPAPAPQATQSNDLTDAELEGLVSPLSPQAGTAQRSGTFKIGQYTVTPK